MKAIILAAGMATRLRPLTDHTPKCLLPVGGRPLLQRSIDALTAHGINDLTIVTGYRSEQIEQYAGQHRTPDLRVRFIHNADYATTNNIYSLWLARPEADGEDVLLLDSDLLYDPAIIGRVVASPAPDVLTLIRHPLGEEEMKVVADPASGRIVEISKTCAPSDAIGESLGIEKMSAAYTAALYRTLGPMMLHEGLTDRYYELAFQRLIAEGHTFTLLDVTDLFSCELDTVDDLQNASRLLPPHLR